MRRSISCRRSVGVCAFAALAAGIPVATATAGGPVGVTVITIPGAQSCDDMTPDGRWIVGTTIGGFVYRRNLETMVADITDAGFNASAVTDDGSMVVGNTVDPQTGQQVAGIWRPGQGWQSLGGLPGGGCGSLSSGYECSADGSVIVGLGWDGCSGQGFRWTQATGMQPLQMLANGNNRASVVSADGTVIGGFAQGSFSRTPAVWSGDTLAGVVLDPPDGDALGEIHGMSDDGSVLLGSWDGAASRWDAGVRTQLGTGSVNPGWEGIPTDIADDGTIVGFDVLSGNRRSWIRVAGTDELVPLRDFVLLNGGTLPEGFGLQVAQAISRDGRIICGHDFPAGGWIVIIERDAPCVGDLDGSGDVGFSDLLELLAAWGGDGPGADLSAPEDEVEFGDLLVLLAAWGPCP